MATLTKLYFVDSINQVEEMGNYEHNTIHINYINAELNLLAKTERFLVYANNRHED
jgi:hypothetical protein